MKKFLNFSDEAIKVSIEKAFKSIGERGPVILDENGIGKTIMARVICCEKNIAGIYNVNEVCLNIVDDCRMTA